jgi:hypothetical protein
LLVLGTHKYGIDVQDGHFLRQIVSVEPSFHKIILDFVSLGRLSVGRDLLKPDIVELTIKHLFLLRPWDLIVIDAIVVAEGRNYLYFREPLCDHLNSTPDDVLYLRPSRRICQVFSRDAMHNEVSGDKDRIELMLIVVVYLHVLED